MTYLVYYIDYTTVVSKEIEADRYLIDSHNNLILTRGSGKVPSQWVFFVNYNRWISVEIVSEP
jgi:hypothetical protein